MVEIQNPKDNFYCLLCLKENQELIFRSDENKKINVNYIDLDKENEEKYIKRIFYFKANLTKNSFKILNGKRHYTMKSRSEQKFLYDYPILDNSFIQLNKFQ